MLIIELTTIRTQDDNLATHYMDVVPSRLGWVRTMDSHDRRYDAVKCNRYVVITDLLLV